MWFTLGMDSEAGRVGKKTIDKQAVARIIIICIDVLIGLCLNYLLIMGTGMLAWYGGVIFWYGQFLLTLSLGMILFSKFRKSWKRLALGTIGYIVLWPILTIGLLIGSDRITVALSQRAAERILRSYGNGELPPGCTIGLPSRADAGNSVDCTSSIKEIKEFFIRKQGGSFTESSNDYETYYIWSKVRNGEISIIKNQVHVYIRVYNKFPLTW